MRLFATLALLLFTHTAHAACAGSLLEVDARRLTGAPEKLCETYAGKVVLVVNTASQCGYTPQYEGLEKLYQKYRSQGLVVLGFPSDEFGGQEPGSDAEIAKFCKLNFGVQFPMFSKGSVKGEAPQPLYRKLIAASGEAPAWNFHKYLVGRDGRRVSAYPSKVKPDDATLLAAIEAELKRTP